MKISLYENKVSFYILPTETNIMVNITVVIGNSTPT